MKEYCVGAKSTCLAKDLAFFYECLAIGIPKLEGTQSVMKFI
jgi:hypothetical protein